MKEINLVSGNIKKSLLQMSLPLMGISFIQMTYSLVDTLWLGRLSTEAVAAAGISSFFFWFANAIAIMSRVGLTTWVSRSYGEGDYNKVQKFIKNSFQLNVFTAIIYTVVVFTLRHQLIGLFNLEGAVNSLGVQYLEIVTIGMIFTFINPMFAGTYNSFGNSVTPFKISTIGLIANIILDPILIFTFDLGIAGAAYATVLAQVLVTFIYIFAGRRSDAAFVLVNYKEKPDMEYVKAIAKTGYPAMVQSGVHGVINLVLNTFVASFGAMPVAVSSIATQVESISWMTAEGVSTAVTSFMGQNLGARNFDRLREGYKEAMKIFLVIGLFASALLVFFGEPIFKVFLPNDPEAIAEGARVLFVFGLAEWALTTEIGTLGAFNGLGLTFAPAVVEVVTNLMRIPMALFLMDSMGILGIWITMSVSMVMKGVILFGMFMYKMKKTDNFRTLVEN